MRYLTLLSLLALSAGTTGAMAGDIYCNNQGRDCSDRPSPGATFVGSTNPSNPQNSAPAAPAANGGNGTPALDAAANARLSQEASRQAVQKDIAATRAEQCKAAKEKYQQSIEARRVYRLNKAGEREYLSDSEADQLRLNARLEMERSCGSPSS
ncbi:MAG: hypothetical protein KGL25_08100 [Gammaproteobacteria bacterium]|nr:hypothetical protein [Gammaproteobacteria bacterium]MDE2251352.1 hypothetical protein [Gammaproteobacteria bacterium]